MHGALATALSRIARQAPGIVVAFWAWREGVAVLGNEAFDALPATCERDTAEAAPRPSRAALLGACRRVIATGLAESLEMGEPGPEGPSRWYRGTVAPVKEGDLTVAAIAVCVDATEEKRQEERLRHREALMVDAEGIAHLGIWEWDPRTQQVTWTEELYRIYGVRPADFAPTYEGYLERLHPDDRQRVREVMDRVATEGAPFNHDERIVREDGAVRYLHTWGHPICDASGRVVRLVGVCQDVTERKLADEALRQSMADLRAVAAENQQLYVEARRAIELRDEFLSIASHELRTPITPVLLQLQALARWLPDDDGERPPPTHRRRPARDLRAIVTLCETQMKRLARLVDSLLDVSRISGGRVTLNREEVDLSELIREVVERLGAELARAGCSTELNLEPRIVGWWDRLRIEEVVASLLTNAMKFGAGKPIRIRASSGAAGAVVSVRDFGIGVSPADKTRIFERFERGVPAKSYGGLGLGLYITRQIAEAHGGSVRVESEPSPGATFVVELPLKSVLGPSR
jgi:PAS domain S-box-containing protein